MSHNMTNPTEWPLRQAKTQISLGIYPVWSETLLSAWRKLGVFATSWVHSKYSDQTGRIPRPIWVFAGRTCHSVGFVMRWLGKFTICSTETMSCVRIMIRLCPLSTYVVHNLVFPLTGDVSIWQYHFNVLPAWVIIQSVVNVESETIGQPKHKWCALQNNRIIMTYCL